MAYIILDPGADYPAALIEFLARSDIQAIAVFTEPGRMLGFRHMYAPRLGEFVVDEYLMTDWPDRDALATQILADHPEPLAGIIPWDEKTILLGAELGEALGIEWNPPEVIQRFRDKFVMKDFLRRHSPVRINASQVVSDEVEALEFRANLDRWPVVVKPAAGAGSRAVCFVETEAELLEACAAVFHAGDGEVLLEEYIGGDEFVVNGLVDADQGFLVTDVWAYDKRPGNGVPNLYFQTVKVSTYDPVFGLLAAYATEVVDCLGLRRAPIHMEVKLDEFGPCLVEVGARFAGGNQPALASELHGRSLFELAACHYLAELPLSMADVSYERYDSAHARIISGVQTVPLPIVSGLLGTAEVEALPSFFGWGSMMPPGLPLPVTVDMSTRSYEVYLMHDDPDQIALDAELVRGLLRYV